VRLVLALLLHIVDQIHSPVTVKRLESDRTHTQLRNQLLTVTMLFRRSSTGVFRPDVAQALTRDVFGFLPQTNVPQSIKAANFRHWETVKLHNQQLQEYYPKMDGIDKICSLIGAIKNEGQKTIQEFHQYLAAKPPPVTWIAANTSEAAVDNALQFVFQLWLFAEPNLNDKSISLQKAVHNSLDSIKAPSNKWLREDFSADTLKSTGLRFIYTHNLAEHLIFASRKEIKIFGHTKVLKRYAESFTAER
jgi:hypothetical protein